MYSNTKYNALGKWCDDYHTLGKLTRISCNILSPKQALGRVFDEVECAKPLSRIEDYDRFTTWWSEMQQSRMILNVTTTMRTTS